MLADVRVFSFADRGAHSGEAYAMPMAGHPISFHYFYVLFGFSFFLNAEFFACKLARMLQLLSPIALKMGELFVRIYIVIQRARKA